MKFLKSGLTISEPIGGVSTLSSLLQFCRRQRRKGFRETLNTPTSSPASERDFKDRETSHRPHPFASAATCGPIKEVVQREDWSPSQATRFSFLAPIHRGSHSSRSWEDCHCDISIAWDQGPIVLWGIWGPGGLTIYTVLFSLPAPVPP